MTPDELPPQAVIIQDAVSKATFSVTTVQALEQVLHSDHERLPTAGKQPATSRRPRIQAATARGVKLSGNRARKQPSVAVLEDRDGALILPLREKLKLATDVVNTSLKLLTSEIQSPAKKPIKLGTTIPRSASNLSYASDSESEVLNPLRPLSINSVTNIAQEKCRSPRSSSTVSKGNTSGLLTTANCGSLAFAILRLVDAQQNSALKTPYLQLEQGMSVFIGKLIALKLYDVAIEELQTLRTRLNTPEIPLANGIGGTLPASKISFKPSLSSSKEPLPDLLVSQNTKARGQHLDLIITSQMQVLRVIAARKNPRAIEVAIRHLDLDSPSSPARLIEQQIDQRSSQTLTKAAQQLESVSRMLFQLCTGSGSEEQQPTSKGISPSVELRYHTLALEIRLKWWKIAGHQGDAFKEIVRPFEKCLTSFRRHSTLTEKEKYVVSQGYVERLLMRLNNLRNHATVQNVERTMCRLQLTLANLAQDYSRFQDADQWMKESHRFLLLSNAPKSLICAFTCRRASLGIRSLSQDGSKQRILSTLEELSVTLRQDLGTDLDELADVVTALNGFRKAVLLMVGSDQQMPDSADRISLDLVIKCSEIFCVAIDFINNIINRSEKQRNTEKTAQSRLTEQQLVLDVAIPFIKSFAFLAKMSMACSFVEWKSIDAGLQRCITLARRYNGSQVQKSAVDDSGSMASCFISISTSYWCRFLNQRQNSTGYTGLQSLLAASIEAFKDQPMRVQVAGLVSTKLEKQASLYEYSKQYLKAAEAYANIVKFLIADGSVNSAADAAATESLQVIIKLNAPFDLLSRSLDGYLKALCNETAGELSPRLILDPGDLSPCGRGLILEYQLTAASSILTSRGCTATIVHLIQELATALLSIYTLAEFPIRRLRVSTKLMHLLTCCPSIVSMDVFGQLSRVWVSDEHRASLGQDIGLERFRDHLCASRDLSAILADNKARHERLDGLLATWSCLLAKYTDWQALEACVNNIADWLLQLEILVQYLELQGLELQRVSTLKILIKLHECATPVQTAGLLSRLSALGLQYTRLGYSGHAGFAFDRAQKYISAHKVSVPNTICWHLSYAEYLLSIGMLDKSESHLAIAQGLFNGYDQKKFQGHQAIELISDAASCYVKLLVAKGDFSKALFFCRLRVKLLHRIWPTSEERSLESSTHEAPHNMGSESENLVHSINSLSISKSSLSITLPSGVSQRSKIETHSLISQSFHSLTSLAEIYAHGGLLPESQYYLEQSAKVAKNVSATAFQCLYHVQLGQYLVRSGNIQEGVSHLDKAEALWIAEEPNKYPVTLQLALAEKHVKTGESLLAMSALVSADSTLGELMQADFIDRLGQKQPHIPVSQTQGDAVTEASPPTMHKVRGKLEAVGNRGTACTANSSLLTSTQPRKSDLLALQCTRARLLRRQASIILQEGDFDRVVPLVKDVEQQLLTPLDRIAHRALTAELALRRALSNMASDLVFCVLPESTTCCPSTRPDSINQGIASDHRVKGLSHQSAPGRSKQGRGNPKATRMSRSAFLPEFVELLCQSQEELNKIRSLAVSAGSTANIHTLVSGLLRTLMILSAFPESRISYSQSPVFAMYVTEIGRTVAMSRQRQALHVEQQLSLMKVAADWPGKERYDVPQLHELLCNDLPSFQSQYLDIIPESWMVLSLTLSDSRDEIRIAKFRPHHCPFVLNLPLARHSQDGDEEAFGFEQGKAELLDIVTLANYSTHDAPDTSRKGARIAWWDARTALDARLKDLLVNMESIWFGGFRGVVGNRMGNPDLLSRFQQSLNNILDNHLPSRQKQTKGQKQDRVMLDSHVLELFVEIGDPNEKDLDEELLDLLYFVIDILQFHGERNAYDEVDFDVIILELLDALRQYHEAAKNQEDPKSSQHTILILDKALHCFPWESLPCLKGQAVSRLPSLGCLRDRILQQTRQHKSATVASLDPIFTVNSSSGAYIINPGGDLTATQLRFEKPLEKLAEWEAIREREPSEREIKTILGTKEIFLYFGHGSGSQYIRSRTIQKLDKCAVSLLMGCSSGALTEAGEFESYGTPISYMQAGCPAVLATLWDVTDKDIDRFSHTVLEKWGLFQESPPEVFSSPIKKGAKCRGKNKITKSMGKGNERRSLDQAVAEGRDSCIMRYLNGAAPIIYGVPVMLSCD